MISHTKDNLRLACIWGHVEVSKSDEHIKELDDAISDDEPVRHHFTSLWNLEIKIEKIFIFDEF